IGLVVERGTLLHPGQISAGGKVPAAAAQYQQAHLVVAADLGQRPVQFGDHLGIEGIVLVRQVEPQRGNPTGVLLQFYSVKISHGGAPGHMRNTPKRVGSMGALSVADRSRASTSRVWAGSMTPSSHRRALE